MSQTLLSRAFRAGFFSTVPAAEKAVADLLAANFSIKQLGIICPERFQAEFSKRIPRERAPAESSPARIVAGASVGAVLGGVALVAATIASGGAVLIPGAMVLIGGGALAGGFSNLIVGDGYRSEFNEYFAQAHDRGQIVVGVHLGTDTEERSAEAAAILRNAGASALAPDDDPTV